jgi:NAD(P) transhydrogenase subunit alpha
MIIGIPTEIMHGERRVAAIPETVATMVADGYEVLVEEKAGDGAFIPDEAYIGAGAEIVAEAADLYARADIILKVKEPQFNETYGCSEIDLMHPGQIIIAFLHPASPVNHDMIRKMAEKQITGLTLDGIPRISRAQNMDALTSMSTCAGYKGMLLAAEDLGIFMPQIFSAVGMIKPAQVLVIGAGVAGLQAIATAKRLGAVVSAVDIRPDAAEQAKSLGARLIETGVPTDLAVGTGGYARRLPSEWLQRERAVLQEAIKDKDIVFCSALVPSQKAPVLLTREMVAGMKPGSVIVDISIDQGGNCAVTQPGETIVENQITIHGIKNIPGMLPVSSTWLFARNCVNLLHYLTENKAIKLDRTDEITASILTTIDGAIVHEAALEAMNES